MKLFVFEDVLVDYSSGMVMIAANSLEEAQALAFDEFHRDYDDDETTIADLCKREPGWASPTGVYETDNKVSGILHTVWGGG
jgi:hypothetical protein